MLTAIVYAIFAISCVCVMIVYFGNVSGFLHQESLENKPIYVAFKSPLLIYVGLIMNISCSFPSVVDLILDIPRRFLPQGDWAVRKEQDSWFERLFLVILNISTCLVVLLFRDNENIPYIYSCAHALQYVGSIAVILLLCHKLEPTHFSAKSIIVAHVSFSLASATSMMGFGHSISYWSNVTTFFLIAIFIYYFLGVMIAPWLLSLKAKVLAGEALPANTLCCLWYSFSTALILIVIPGIVALTSFFDWSQFTAPDVYIFVYSFVLYGVIISSVPGRLARADADNERRTVEIKQALIRYLSHEVRSPLNVIYSGINFMMSDIAALYPCREKDLIMDSLNSVRQACQDVLQAMNDMLQMETMNSGNFSLDRKMVPCKEIIEIMENCGILAKQKGVLFSVTESVSLQSLAIAGASCHADLRASLQMTVNNIEDGDVEDGSIKDIIPSNHEDLQILDNSVAEGKLVSIDKLALYVDKFKLGQALRNLITNAVKFTPVGESIAVNIRLATAEDLERMTEMKETTSNSAINNNNSLGFEFANNVVVEVADTGCGIAEEDQPKVFGAFAQFNANELQVV